MFRAESNRQNSFHSTGPKTPAWKAKVRAHPSALLGRQC